MLSVIRRTVWSFDRRTTSSPSRSFSTTRCQVQYVLFAVVSDYVQLSVCVKFNVATYSSLDVFTTGFRWTSSSEYMTTAWPVGSRPYSDLVSCFFRKTRTFCCPLSSTKSLRFWMHDCSTGTRQVLLSIYFEEQVIYTTLFLTGPDRIHSGGYWRKGDCIQSGRVRSRRNFFADNAFHAR
jgi:hypothetical protein